MTHSGVSCHSAGSESGSHVPIALTQGLLSAAVLPGLPLER